LPAIRPPVHAGGFFISAPEAQGFGAKPQIIGSHSQDLGAGCYCVRNLYATIRATMLAKISSAGRDFRIIGIVEWRAADRPG
jgi:hypothetical protein